MNDFGITYINIPFSCGWSDKGCTANSAPVMYAATVADRTAQEWEEWVCRTDGPYISWTLEKHRRDGLTHALYLFARRLVRRV
jgi:hypothetical protein